MLNIAGSKHDLEIKSLYAVDRYSLSRTSHLFLVIYHLTLNTIGHKFKFVFVKVLISVI